ncbi:MAG: hypothetical protein KDK36_12690 [Leptospiraceae bacterium]|nr:hypothetical protein [Leptospiraceae bacterium]
MIPSNYQDITFSTAEKYLSKYDLPDDKRIFINTGFFGSGKTQSIINHYKRTKQTFIFIHPTRALIKDVSERLRKEGIKIKTHLELNKENSLGCYDGNIDSTIESLINIDFSLHKDSLFIFDEFSTILSQVFAPINKDRRNKIFDSLRYIFKYCKVVVFDSLLEGFEIDCILDLSGGNRSDLDILSNSEYNPPKRDINIYYSQGKFENELIDNCRNKKILLLTDNVSFSDSIISIINKDSFVNCSSLCKDTREEILKDKTINEFIEEKKPQFLSVSPTGFTGLDISLNYFDEVYLYSDNIGISDYRVYIQALHRERDYTKPISIYSKNYEFDPTIKTDYLEILSEYDRRNKAQNYYFETELNKEGVWVTRPELRDFEILKAQKKGYENICKISGLSQYIIDYYSRFKDENGKTIFWFNYIKDELETIPKEKAEKAEIKRERLKALPLIDKSEYENLKIEQSKRDLKKDERESISKYELSRKLGIGNTDFNRADLINEVYDYSINDSKLNKLSDRIESYFKDNETLYQEEKETAYNEGFDFNPSSKILEKKVFIDFINQYKDKEFSKIDFDIKFIDKLETITGSNFGERFKDEIIKRDCYQDLYKRVGYSSLVLEYAYEISRGNEEIIRKYYNDEFQKIFDSSMNSFDRQISRIESRVKDIKKRESRRSKLMNETISKIQEKQKKLLIKIQYQFKISPIDIISDWLSSWGIRLEQTRKNGRDGIRYYKLDLRLFQKLTNFEGTKNKSFL